MLSSVGNIDIFLSLGVAVGLFFVGILFAVINRVPGQAFTIKVFSLAFILRMAAAFSIYYSLIAVGGDGFVIADDRAYDKTAHQIDRDLTNNRQGFKEVGEGYSNIAYFNLNGFVYHYLGFDTMTSRMLNVFFGAIIVLLGYYIMLQLFDIKLAKIAAVLMAVLPNLIFWSASQVKDPLITLCTMSLIYIMVCKFRSGITLSVVVAYLFFMVLLLFLRKDFCLPLIVVSIIWFVFRYTFFARYFNDPQRSVFMKMGLMFILSIPLILGMISTQSGEELTDTISKFNEMQRELSDSNGMSSSAGFSRYLRVVTPTDFYKLPLAMAFTAIAPLPSFRQVTDPVQYGAVLYSFTNIPLVLMMPFIFVGFVKFKSASMEFTDELLIKWLPMLILASITILYMGVLRYKTALMPYFMMWAAFGWCHRRRYKAHIELTYIGTFIGFFIVLSLATMLR